PAAAHADREQDVVARAQHVGTVGEHGAHGRRQLTGYQPPLGMQVGALPGRNHEDNGLGQGTFEIGEDGVQDVIPEHHYVGTEVCRQGRSPGASTNTTAWRTDGRRTPRMACRPATRNATASVPTRAPARPKRPAAAARYAARPYGWGAATSGADPSGRGTSM